MGHGDWYGYLRAVHKISPNDPRFMPPERVNSLISQQLSRQVAAGPKNWIRSRTPVTATVHSLANLYNLARVQKKRGKPFFGHGDWYTYLNNMHGVSPLTRDYMPDARLHKVISQQLPRTTKAREWQMSKEHDTPSGHSLANLYTLAYTRRKRGKSFFGYGSWSRYLEAEHGIKKQ